MLKPSLHLGLYNYKREQFDLKIEEVVSCVFSFNSLNIYCIISEIENCDL